MNKIGRVMPINMVLKLLFINNNFDNEKLYFTNNLDSDLQILFIKTSNRA